MNLCTSIKSLLVLVRIFLALLYSELVSIVHYIDGRNLIYTLHIMIKSALQKKKAAIFRYQE